MSRGRIVSIAWDLFEFLPLMIFVYLGRFGSEISERFVWGAAAALLVMPCLVLARRQMNPLVIAANIWLLIEGLAFITHVPPLSSLLVFLRETAFFLVIVIVGALFLCFSKTGLFATASQDHQRVRGYSLLLLLLATASAIWSFFHRGDEFVAASLPAIALFVLQMVLASRLKADRLP